MVAEQADVLDVPWNSGVLVAFVFFKNRVVRMKPGEHISPDPLVAEKADKHGAIKVPSSPKALVATKWTLFKRKNKKKERGEENYSFFVVCPFRSLPCMEATVGGSPCKERVL